MATRFITLALAAVAVASPVTRLQQRQSANVIASCTKPGVVALTFDDGPYDFTDAALDLFAAAGFKATFFLNGDNWGSIYDHADTVRRTIADGHQIGSHTWSHPDIATLSPAQLIEEMSKLDVALTDIIGKTPTYMRPPFFSWNDANLATLGGLGYKVIHADVDTLDWELNYPAALANFNKGIDNGGSIVLAHDVHPDTVAILIPQMIASLKARGLKSVTVGECLGDAPANWYKSSGTPTDPEPEPTPTPTEPTEPEEPTSTTPTEPEEPTSTPTDPEEPTATPTSPTEPEEPTSTPTEPEEPTATPTNPTEPEEPTATPTSPTDPEEPSYPEEPTSTPTGPTEPEEPSYPEDPSYTEEPTPTPTPSTKPPHHGCYKKRQAKA